MRLCLWGNCSTPPGSLSEKDEEGQAQGEEEAPQPPQGSGLPSPPIPLLTHARDSTSRSIQIKKAVKPCLPAFSLSGPWLFQQGWTLELPSIRGLLYFIFFMDTLLASTSLPIYHVPQ